MVRPISTQDYWVEELGAFAEFDMLAELAPVVELEVHPDALAEYELLVQKPLAVGQDTMFEAACSFSTGRMCYEAACYAVVVRVRDQRCSPFASAIVSGPGRSSRHLKAPLAIV